MKSAGQNLKKSNFSPAQKDAGGAVGELPL
jgi:hypothetical protein